MLTPDQFLRRTKAKSVRITTNQPYTDGGSTFYNLPQAGLAHCLWVSIGGTVTVGGTVTSGTIQSYPYPAPFSIVKRLRFGNNNSLYMRDITGWGWYKWVRYRTGIDFLSNQSVAKFSTNSLAALGTTVTNPLVPGANVVAQTYNFFIAMPIPLSYNEAAEQGLIVLQTNGVQYALSIDWGRWTGGIGATGGTNDLFNALVGTTLVVTASITITIGLDWFEPVAGVGNLISMFMTVNEQAFTPLINGVNLVTPPPNDYYTLLLLEVINAGAPVAVANFSNIFFQYAGQVFDYMDDYQTKIVRSSYQHQIPPMDGCIDWDLGIRRGFLTRRDTLDAFNDQAITDMKLSFTLPGSLSISGTNQTTAVYESLRLINQSRGGS